MRAALLTSAFAVIATLTACAGGGSDAASGEPAAAADADRTVTVVMDDDLTYDPMELVVAVGEVVTFDVTNAGEVTHELVLGAPDEQAEHADEMAGMDGMHHADATALSLDAGESGTITWAFTAPGRYEYACHEPGHLEGGMVGVVTVEDA